MLSAAASVVAVGAGAFLFATPAAYAAAPSWKLTVTPSADYFTPGSEAENNVYTIEAENVGEAPTSGAIRLQDTLPSTPAGFSAVAVHFRASPLGLTTELASSDCPSPLECEYPGTPALAKGEKLVMQVRVRVPEAAAGLSITDSVKVSGGGAPKAAASATNEASSEPTIGFHSFAAPLTATLASEPPNLTPYSAAAAHPFQLVTNFRLTTKAQPQGRVEVQWGQVGVTPVRDPRDVAAELPPGLIGDPQAVPRCELALFFLNECPIKTVIGTAGVRHDGSYQGAPGLSPLFNLEPAGAYPGELGVDISFPYFITASLRSGSDYGLTLTNAGIPMAGINWIRVVTWGVPAEEAHNNLRGKVCSGGGGLGAGEIFLQSPEQVELNCETEPTQFGTLNGGPAGYPPTPFLRTPTACSTQALPFTGRYDVWENTEVASAGYPEGPFTGCGSVHFDPTIEALPTTNLADAPSGLSFDLHVPQGCWQAEGSPGFEALCQSDLSEAVVKLPAGITVNPSSANGLGACSPAQIGLKTEVGATPAHFTEEPAQCPAAAKLGEAEVNTPLLHEPLNGSVYLATPHQNPFNSLLAAYIVLEGQGLIVKLAGKIETDPQTGQLTGRFLETPQTPFEDFHLKFFEGARGDLRTPAVCGKYETTAELTPWSHMEGETEATPIAHPAASFETTDNGAPCPHSPTEEPNAPRFHAGTESPQAGAFSPFSLKLVREDGSQELKGIDTTLPPGLVGRLAGVGECSEAQLAAAAAQGHSGAAEQASPSCPASSEVGTVEVASGAGPTPLYVKGHAYLAGPYKGAPLSLAIITPAVAGPFDLGTVVVRTALYVNPETAQIKAVSDPIPHILQGIPLDVRSITLKTARPNFTLNPTDCEELGFTGSALSVLGVSAPLTQRFQVGGCSALPFKPKLKLSLKGGTKRAQNPALKAVLTAKPGEANIAAAQVTLPRSEFLDNAHIQTVCTRVQFSASACPAGSIYGFAKALTPLLDKPLEGPVYLRSSSNKLPDLVAALNGQIQVVLDGRIDTGKGGGIRNTFEVVPDAPVTKFTLEMQGGNKGLLENSENLCSPRAKTHATVDLTGQNGKTYDTTPAVANSCAKKKHKGHGKHHHRRRAG